MGLCRCSAEKASCKAVGRGWRALVLTGLVDAVSGPDGEARSLLRSSASGGFRFQNDFFDGHKLEYC